MVTSRFCPGQNRDIYTTHTALDNITPNQAISDPKKREHGMHLNIIKAQQNGFITDLKPGDKVRIDDTSLFKKGTESRWSDEVHVVQSATGAVAQLVARSAQVPKVLGSNPAFSTTHMTCLFSASWWFE